MKCLCAIGVAVALTLLPAAARGEGVVVPVPEEGCAPLPCCLARGATPTVLMPGTSAAWCGLLIPREGAEALAIHYAEPQRIDPPPTVPMWPFWAVGLPAALIVGGIVGAMIVWTAQ